MKTQGNDPAMPTGHNQSGTGLTKREEFAKAAMQGLISNCYYGAGMPNDLHAKEAVKLADALIEALNKTELS